MGGGEEQDKARDKMGGESSEDEYELVPKSVDNYWLEDGDENPISFATLPYFKADDDVLPDQVLFLRGTQDNGTRLFVKALAWRLELTKPAFQVKTEKYWIGLSKPRKSYEGTIRSIMIVAHFLNYAIANPDQPEKAAWNHLSDIFPSFEVRPNQSDLSTHLPLIQQLITIEEGLAGSCALESVVAGSSKKKLASSTEDVRIGSMKRSYVSDDEPEPSGDRKRLKSEVDEPDFGEEMEGLEEDSELEEIGDLSETVCSICDNGGDVICCDGPCMRSFHLNKGADGASDASCATLGFSKADVERMDKFFCPNCKFKEHQCYICGELGCSDEAGGAPQKVFMCDAAICGHFYHPDCVADVILKDKDQSEKDILAESIKEGKGFVCPMHKCLKCGKGENKEDEELQFGVCRRCPRVWHRQCFPPYLLFEATDDEPQRAWEDLLTDRILIFCKKHKISSKLGTPLRDHVKFPPGSLPSAKKPVVRTKPDMEEKKVKGSKADSQKKKRDLVKSGIPEFKVPKRKSELDISKKKADSFISRSKPDITRPTKSKPDLDGTVSQALKKKSDEHLQSKQDEPVSVNKSRQAAEGYAKQDRSSVAGQKFGKPPLPKDSLIQLLEKKNKPSPYIVAKITPMESEIRSLVDEIIEKTKNSVSIESIQRKHDVPLCYRRYSKTPDKKYSLVKIESIIRGMRKAVETLENGGSIEDAKVKCSPAFVKHLEGCKTELRVYLSPFLHGARYTSFGRHFTKTDKLQEIVDRAQWYLQSGDMVVDFCCGANEFSLLMKKKLQGVGKKCDYKNFDIIQTKNDFNFEKRDWFQVKQDQLPDGNRLIMGLNPPFGVKGQLANGFIDHALKFKPKLIILIVPKETERLDQKPDKYDLVWEDPELLKGHSFYLPGSVDVNENPLSDWNAVAPPLSIWSRPDWTPRFRQIAQDQGHISKITTPGPARFAGSPWIAPLRPLSPVKMSDIIGDKKKTVPASVEPRIIEEIASRQDVITKEDRSVPSRLKEMSQDEPFYKTSRNDGLGTVTSERSEARRAKSVAGGPEEDTKMHQVNQSSRKGLDDSAKAMEKGKLSERQDRRTGAYKQRKKESPDRPRQSTETRQGRAANDRYNRGPDTKIDISKYDDQRQKSPEKYRHMESEPRGIHPPDIRDRQGIIEGVRSPDNSRTFIQGMNSPERYGRITELQNEPAGLTEKRKHSPEEHNWHERISESSRLYGQGLKLPEAYGHMPEPINDTARLAERRETSHDRFEHSSVVDLENHHLSNRDRNMDSFNDYNALLRRANIDKEYRDSIYQMPGSTDSKSEWRSDLEDPKSTWSKYNYGGKQASEDLERATGFLHKDYMDSSIQREATIYQDKVPYMKNYSDSQDGAYRKMDYLDRENFSGRQNGLDFQSVDGFHKKMDYDNTVLERANDLEAAYLRRDYTTELTRTQNYKGLDVQASGHFGETPFERRNTDLFSSELSAGIHGLQGYNYSNTSQVEPAMNIYSRYGIPETSDLRTKSSYNLSSSAGLLPLPDRTFNHPQLPGRESGLSTNPTLTYPLYGSLHSVQQPAMPLNEPSLHPSHGLFDTHQARQHGNLPMNPLDGRFTNQSRGQFSGGWIDD